MIIEDKMSGLEITQIEALEVSSGLRKNCPDDIDKFFNSIDAKILAFIGDQIAELEGSHNDLLSELSGLESKCNQLEQMIKEDSR